MAIEAGSCRGKLDGRYSGSKGPAVACDRRRCSTVGLQALDGASYWGHTGQVARRKHSDRDYSAIGTVAVVLAASACTAAATTECNEASAVGLVVVSAEMQT